jgi:hypothetical protein
VEDYRHTRIGYLTIGVLGAGCVFVGFLLLYSSITKGFDSVAAPVALSVLLALLVALVLFSRLTTSVEDRTLEVWFGPGWPRRVFPLADVTDIRVGKAPWYAGWGIRWLGRGWLFNVSGRDVVELRMKDGRRYLIGTDAPQALEAAIRRGMR